MIARNLTTGIERHDGPQEMRWLRQPPTVAPRAIPKHTDQSCRHAPLGLQTFHCLRTGGTGGETVLADAFEIARVFRETEPEAFEVLSTVPHQFYRYVEGRAAYYSEACIISVDYFGEVTGFRYANRQTSSPLDMPEHLVKPVHDALRKLSALMRDPAFEIKFLLKPGDMMIFDNQRLIHGRTHYDDTSGARHLRTMEASRHFRPDARAPVCAKRRRDFCRGDRCTWGRMVHGRSDGK